MAEQYPEPRLSDYIYTPQSGSANHRCRCGHELHWAPMTRVVVLCDDCVKEMDEICKRDPRCVKVASEADIVKAKEIAKADAKDIKEKQKVRSYFRGRTPKED